MQHITSILALAILLFTAPMATHAVEEPDYQVTRKLGDIEIRQYSPYVVAEVTVAGPASEAGNQAFGILAGYIFGKNKGERKLAMTAPVTQRPTPAKMAMTAPVKQRSASAGYVVQFVLPKDVSLDTAPEPLDARVTVRQEPAARMAVIRFSGFWSDSNYDRHLAELERALTTAGLQWEGQPIYSRYNPPFMPWFLRRNEIWLPLP